MSPIWSIKSFVFFYCCSFCLPLPTSSFLYFNLTEFNTFYFRSIFIPSTLFFFTLFVLLCSYSVMDFQAQKDSGYCCTWFTGFCNSQRCKCPIICFPSISSSLCVWLNNEISKIHLNEMRERESTRARGLKHIKYTHTYILVHWLVCVEFRYCLNRT